MGTRFVNDDLDICSNLSTLLVSFPGTGFNFSWSFEKPSRQTYSADKQMFNAHDFETKLHIHTTLCQMWVNKYIYVNKHVDSNGLSNKRSWHSTQGTLFSSGKGMVWDTYRYTHWTQAVSGNVYLISSSYTDKGSYIWFTELMQAPCSHIRSLVYRYSYKHRSTWACKR